jgi:hypothetical protein
MHPYGMQTWVAGNHLQAISGSRVTSNDGIDLVEKRIKHWLILTGKG